MCVDENAVHLDAIFEPVNVATPSQDIPFEYHETLPVNVKSATRAGTVLRFKFPREGLMIPHSLSFFFTLTVDWVQPGGRRLFLTSDIRNVFSRATLLLGRTTVLEDLQEYGMLCRTTDMYESETSRIISTEGYMSGNTLRFNATNLTDAGTVRSTYHNISGLLSTRPGQVPRRYKTNVKLGMFEQNKPIPLMFMNEELMLEFTTAATAGAFCFSDSASHTFGDTIPSYQIGRPVLRYRVYYPTLQLKNQIFNRMAQDAYILQWSSYQYQRFSVPITQRTHRFNIQCKYKRLKYAIATLRCEDDILDIGQDSTYIYASLDPRIDPAVDSTAGKDQARKTMLKQYQWFYNNTAIPRLPVQVAGGEKVYTVLHDSAGATLNTFSVDTHYTSTGVEAYYYLRETLGLTDAQTGPATGDVTFLCHDSFNNSVDNNPVTTKLSETNTPGVFKTALTGFVMAGKFSDKIVLPDSSVEETALDCQTPNANLQLQLEFNAASGAGSAFLGKNPTIDGGTGLPIPGTGGFPNMYLDVWLRYDTLAQINHRGEVEIIQ